MSDAAPVREPDLARREGLPDYPFEAHFVEIPDEAFGSLTMCYVDEGGAENPVILLLHGEPSWSYLYRHVIPPLVDAGFRVLAPDLIGFGFSDKPTIVEIYSYERHVEWLCQWFNRLELDGVNLFCQDWGGLLGLVLVSRLPERFMTVTAANTGLPTGDGTLSPAFDAWRAFVADTPDLPVGQILQGATVRELSPAEVAAYEAPFPDLESKAGARAFPALVPIEPDNPGVHVTRAAWERLQHLELPFATTFSDADPVTAGQQEIFKARIPGAKDAPHPILKGGGHFLQEDVPEQIVEHLIAFAKVKKYS